LDLNNYLKIPIIRTLKDNRRVQHENIRNIGVIAFVLYNKPQVRITQPINDIVQPVHKEATSVQNLTTTDTSIKGISLSEYIMKVESIRKSLINDSNGFIQAEYDYLSRKINQEQALEQFNENFSSYKKTVNELISLKAKIKQNDLMYLANQELLKITEEYYNHMVGKISSTEKGLERSVTASKRMGENLSTFDYYFKDLKDLNAGK
jgi:hypothetical protein